jgi:hypothetical protein
MSLVAVRPKTTTDRNIQILIDVLRQCPPSIAPAIRQYLKRITNVDVVATIQNAITTRQVAGGKTKKKRSRYGGHRNRKRTYKRNRRVRQQVGAASNTSIVMFMVVCCIGLQTAYGNTFNQGKWIDQLMVGFDNHQLLMKVIYNILGICTLNAIVAEYSFGGIPNMDQPNEYETRYTQAINNMNTLFILTQLRRRMPVLPAYSVVSEIVPETLFGDGWTNGSLAENIRNYFMANDPIKDPALIGPDDDDCAIINIAFLMYPKITDEFGNTVPGPIGVKDGHAINVIYNRKTRALCIVDMNHIPNMIRYSRKKYTTIMSYRALFAEPMFFNGLAYKLIDNEFNHQIVSNDPFLDYYNFRPNKILGNIYTATPVNNIFSVSNSKNTGTIRDMVKMYNVITSRMNDAFISHITDPQDKLLFDTNKRARFDHLLPDILLTDTTASDLIANRPIKAAITDMYDDNGNKIMSSKKAPNTPSISNNTPSISNNTPSINNNVDVITLDDKLDRFGGTNGVVLRIVCALFGICALIYPMTRALSEYNELNEIAKKLPLHEYPPD